MADALRIRSYLRRGLVAVTLGSAVIGSATGVAGASGAVGLSRTTPADAATGLLLSLDQGQTWIDEVTEPILPEDELLNPGEAMSAVVGVRNATGGPLRLSLQARDIENGGELGDHLRFTVTRDPERDGTFESTPVFSGTLAELGQGTPLADAEMPDGTDWDYRVEVALDEDAGNDVAGDEVSFTFAWRGTADDGTSETVNSPAVPGGGETAGGGDIPAPAGVAGQGGGGGTGTDVLGEKHTTADPAPSPFFGTLPVTGTDLVLVVGGGLGLLMLGLGLRLLRREAMS